jgi:hypothetical protein
MQFLVEDLDLSLIEIETRLPRSYSPTSRANGSGSGGLAEHKCLRAARQFAAYGRNWVFATFRRLTGA